MLSDLLGDLAMYVGRVGAVWGRESVWCRLGPVMRALTHLVEVGRVCPRSTRWVQLLIGGRGE